MPKTADLLRTCADRGLAVVLATSGQESDLEWMVPAIGARDAVTGAITSADVDQGKPEPDLLTTAMRDHGLDPQRTVVVGDTVWDVEAAQRAGLPGIPAGPVLTVSVALPPGCARRSGSSPSRPRSGRG